MPVAGTSANYVEKQLGGLASGYDMAKVWAQNHMDDGGDRYAFVSDGVDGYLFADMNGNGTVGNRDRAGRRHEHRRLQLAEHHLIAGWLAGATLWPDSPTSRPRRAVAAAAARVHPARAHDATSAFYGALKIDPHVLAGKAPSPMLAVAAREISGSCRKQICRCKSPTQRLRHPVCRQRAELVADVEADVVAFRVDDQLGRPRGGFAPAVRPRLARSGGRRRRTPPATGHRMFCERALRASTACRAREHSSIVFGMRAHAEDSPAKPSASSAARCPNRTDRSWRCSP